MTEPPAVAEPVEAPPVRVLGVRHHGPGSARAVVRALDAYRPECVLVEGPADADPLVGWVGDAGLVPPVHVYGRGDGVSVTGGVVYRGPALPELEGVLRGHRDRVADPPDLDVGLLRHRGSRRGGDDRAAQR